MSEQTERDTHFAGFAQLLWEEMLSQTVWQGIDVTAGHIPLHHPEDEEHQIYIQIIARRAYDLAMHVLSMVPHLMNVVPDAKILPEVIQHLPDIATWPEPTS